MIEPVDLQDFFATFFASALIILAGASYALLIAWSKLHPESRIKYLAYCAYCVLLVAVVILTKTAHFKGYWLILSWVMVIGYFFAPIAIWHLCVKTHSPSSTTNEESS